MSYMTYSARGPPFTGPANPGTNNPTNPGGQQQTPGNSIPNPEYGMKINNGPSQLNSSVIPGGPPQTLLNGPPKMATGPVMPPGVGPIRPQSFPNQANKMGPPGVSPGQSRPLGPPRPTAVSSAYGPPRPPMSMAGTPRPNVGPMGPRVTGPPTSSSAIQGQSNGPQFAAPFSQATVQPKSFGPPPSSNPSSVLGPPVSNVSSMSGPPPSSRPTYSGHPGAPPPVSSAGVQSQIPSSSGPRTMLASGPPTPGQMQTAVRTPAPPAINGHQFQSQIRSGPPIPGQFPATSGPPIPGQFPATSGPPIPGQFPATGGPPLTGQLPPPTSGAPPPGQFSALSRPPLPGQLPPTNRPPLPGQLQNHNGLSSANPTSLNGPPLSATNGPPPPPMGGKMGNGPPFQQQSGHLNSRPPLPGQQQQQQGGQNNFNNSQAPSMQGQHQNSYGPPLDQQQQQNFSNNNNKGFANGGVLNGRSFSGIEPVDLLQNRHILPPKPIEPPKPKLQTESWNKVNCSTEIFRCTLTKIPESENILKKSRLPLGVLIHPFKDLSHLPVIQCSTIVRCRQCRTYINPFVHFVDQRRWRCNICYRVNDLPEEFLYDPVSKTYGDPSRRPECKSSTIEFIAPSEYMLRPPQPAVYIFCLDVSRQALENGYLKVFCDSLLEDLDKLPGDGRTQVGFITYDRCVHFYSMPDGATQPTQLTVSDIDDMFLPSPSDLLVNLNECRQLVEALLSELPNMFKETHVTDSALGSALQAAYKLAAPTGGRISIFQTTLPNCGPGKVNARETASDKSGENVTALLGPATDFYKKLALDCSGQQVAVDLFTLSSQFVDLGTLSGISKFCGGQVQHFPGYHHAHNTSEATKFENALRRYLTRKIGFEAVMRIRCTRGLTPHTFHGNFFVRSTDLLALPNINPDAGFAMQVSIEDDLRESRDVSFQAALLYTSSKGERRIRVHTFCLPTTASVSEVINSADQHAIIGMLAKFAADRATNDSMSDAKTGLVVSNVDTLETYKTYSSIGNPSGLLISQSLRLLPLFTLACMRSKGFRNGQPIDSRSFCFSQFKTLPLCYLLQYIYPDLYKVDDLSEEGGLKEFENPGEEDEEDDLVIPQPPRLQLSYERISATGMYAMDCGDVIFLYLCRGLHQFVLEKIFGVTRLHQVDETLTELPDLDNSESDRLRTFIGWLNGNKPYAAPIRIIREDGQSRHLFSDRMIEDRMDNSFSYFEFLQHLKQQIKS